MQRAIAQVTLTALKAELGGAPVFTDDELERAAVFLGAISALGAGESRNPTAVMFLAEVWAQSALAGLLKAGTLDPRNIHPDFVEYQTGLKHQTPAPGTPAEDVKPMDSLTFDRLWGAG